MQIKEIDWSGFLLSVRELVKDISPVLSFKMQGQDFLFEEGVGIRVNSELIKFSDFPKIHLLTRELIKRGVEIKVWNGFVSNEWSEGVTTMKDIGGVKEVWLDYYFSEMMIEEVCEQYFSEFLPFDGKERSVQEVFNYLDYFHRKKMAYWVAYHLVDMMRANDAFFKVMKHKEGVNTDSCDSLDFKQTEQQITTRVGEVFSISESVKEDGKGMEGFTTLWGDKYGYYTKLQLWIRGRYETMFNDYSLRDDTLRITQMTVDKNWLPFAYTDPMRRWSEVTADIFT